MRSLFQWLKKRFHTFDYLPEYFEAVRLHFLDVIWGIGVGAGVPYMIWGLYSIFKTPPPVANWLAIVGALFLSGYYLWRADHLRLRQTLDITRVLPQEWLDQTSQKPVFGYYIEVVNTSEAVSILEAKAQLMEIIPKVHNLDWLPVLLKQKHDRTDEKLFDVHPGDKKHIDLVAALQGSKQFTVQHLVTGVNNQVDGSERHRLKVVVTARHTPARCAWFEVWIDEKGVLQCKMEPKPKNSMQS